LKIGWGDSPQRRRERGVGEGVEGNLQGERRKEKGVKEIKEIKEKFKGSAFSCSSFTPCKTILRVLCVSAVNDSGF
jgi:hypothetical protein